MLIIEVSMISLIGVEKRASSTKVSAFGLREIRLLVKRGDYLVVSGEGSSSLLGLIGLLERADGGDVLIDGKSVIGLPEGERAALREELFGFVFGSALILPNCTARKNLEIPIRFARLPPRARRGRAMELLCKVGLADRSATPAASLSVVERRMLAIARGIANDPGYLLVDDPVGDLSPGDADLVRSLLMRLNAEGLAIIESSFAVEPPAGIPAFARRAVLSNGILIS